MVIARLRDDARAKNPKTYAFRPLTLDDVLSPGFGSQQLYYSDQRGYMARVRLNGRVKTWKRDPSRVEIPVKFGFYEAFRVTDPAELFYIVETKSNPKRKRSRQSRRNPPPEWLTGPLPQWVKDAGIEEGDRIEFEHYAGRGMRGAEYKRRTGRVHLLGPAGPVVVLPGDRFGASPVVVSGERFVRIVSRKHRKNPRRRGKRVVTRSRVRRGISMRQARARVFKALGGRGVFKQNPMSKKDFEYMAALIAQAHLSGVSESAREALMEFALELGEHANPRFDASRFIKRVVQLVEEKAPFRYVNRNPATLAVIGNPRRAGARAVATLGKVVEIRYQRTIQPGKGKYFKHPYDTPMNLVAMSDGSLSIHHPRVAAWAREG